MHRNLEPPRRCAGGSAESAGAIRTRLEHRARRSTIPKPPMAVLGKATIVNRILFAVLSNGIRFDRADVAATIDQARGGPMYFQNYLSTLTLEEHRIVLRLLPAATHWFIQAGSLDMFATANAKKAFMVGGIGDDNQWKLAA